MTADEQNIPFAAEWREPPLSDEDILDAMRQIPGYIDISTDDFRLIYHLAWQHAVAHLRAVQAKATGKDA